MNKGLIILAAGVSTAVAGLGRRGLPRTRTNPKLQPCLYEDIRELVQLVDAAADQLRHRSGPGPAALSRPAHRARAGTRAVQASPP